MELFNPRPQPYNFNKIKADVLVLGSFGKTIFAQIYPPALVDQYYRRVAQLDRYDIYVRRGSSLFRPDRVRAAASPALPVLKARQ